MNRSGFPEPLLETLRAAHRVTALTGSGISAESGVPTFRDAQTGLWSNYPPEDLATPEAFRKNPRMVWEWYAGRRQRIAQVRPNAGHLALACMEALYPGFTLVTQNVDGLHQQAGSRNVIELHGNLQRTKCFDENLPVETWHETGDNPPRCPRCGGLLRPDVVWFGEQLPAEALRAATQAAKNSEVFFSIGTSSLVEPAASLSYLALQAGACLIEINPNRTPLSASAAYTLSGPAGEVLPALLKML